MNKRAIATALLLAFSPAVFSATAFAQKGDPVTTEAARARFQEGVDHFDKGQFEQARAAFLQAYALRKHPAVLLNLAQSSLRSGHTLEAARFFEQFLREANTATQSQRADAERGLAEARTKLARLDISAPSGTEISLDGERMGLAPLAESLDVEPGAHVVKAGAEEKRMDVAAGQRIPVRFGAASAVATAPPATVEAPPPAAVATPAHETGISGADSGAGKKRNLVPVYIGGGVALAGVGTAIAMVIAKNNAQNSANAVRDEIVANAGSLPTQGLCSRTDTATVTRFGKACAALSDDNNKVDTDALIGNVALGVGIAGAVFSTAWFLFAPAKENSSPTTAILRTTTVTPWIAPGTSGFAIAHKF